jgi:lipid-A-disaccharide synthase
MRMAGATLLEDTEAMGAIGLWEPLPFVASTLLLQARLGRWMKSHPLDGVVLIDYMGANVGLGRRIKKRYHKVPIFYYIAPQEWAFSLWEGRTTSLISFTDQILAIFPEEARFYGQRGATVTWVGHPLIDTWGSSPAGSRREPALICPLTLLCC